MYKFHDESHWQIKVMSGLLVFIILLFFGLKVFGLVYPMSDASLEELSKSIEPLWQAGYIIFGILIGRLKKVEKEEGPTDKFEVKDDKQS